MTPPEIQGQGIAAAAPARSPAVSLCVMAKRADYLKAAAARRQGTGGFLLQARDRADGDPVVRVGFTASKKIGNAVLRNRAKRRLRALAREVLAPEARPGWDYVLVARPEATVTRSYADLCADLRQALATVHRGRA
jgi:ribonuclease P protein component